MLLVIVHLIRGRGILSSLIRRKSIDYNCNNTTNSEMSHTKTTSRVPTVVLRIQKGWQGRKVDFPNLRKLISSIWKAVNPNRMITIFLSWISINLGLFLLRNKLLISMIMTTPENHQILPWKKFKNLAWEYKKTTLDTKA